MKDKSIGMLPPEEEKKMLEANPYIPSKWWFPTRHEQINNRYVYAWNRGKFYVLSKFIDYIKEKEIPKVEFREFFAQILNKPDFGLKEDTDEI